MKKKNRFLSKLISLFFGGRLQHIADGEERREKITTNNILTIPVRDLKCLTWQCSATPHGSGG